MDQVLVHLLNGLSAGLMLFMLSAGLTLIYSMMGVLNFAHASFYMLGAYAGYQLQGLVGFGAALVAAPLLVGLGGAVFEHVVLRRVHPHGHVAELLATFGAGFVVLELVQLVWGRASVPFAPPTWLEGPAFTVGRDAAGRLALFAGDAPPGWCAATQTLQRCAAFPLTRCFMAGSALLMLLLLWALLQRTRVGLLVKAALTHPQMLQALGHDVPRIFMGVFGVGCGLAALAGVLGGMTFVTEPGMAAMMGPIVFVVVVVGGTGSLAGALVGSLLVGLLQTLPLAVEGSLLDVAHALGWSAGPATPGYPLLKVTLAQAAPMLPYLLLALMLVVRPQGLLGARDR